MTGEEEQLLREYLSEHDAISGVDDDAGFEAWYRWRHEGGEHEVEYKHTLELARVWRSRYQEGYADALEAFRLATLGIEPGTEGV